MAMRVKPPSHADRAKSAWKIGLKYHMIDGIRLDDPVNEYPYFSGAHVWRWVQVPSGMWVFPSIEPPPYDDITLEFIFLGQDHDGYDVFMVGKGEQLGKTVRMVMEDPFNIADGKTISGQRFNNTHH